MFPDIWHALSARMNFTFTIERAYEWGSVVNGTWSGMIGKAEFSDINNRTNNYLIVNRKMHPDYSHQET